MVHELDVLARELLAEANPHNTFTGQHCSDFGQYMSTTGVYDTNNNNHRGWAGVTESFPSIGKFNVTPTVSTQNLWECPCKPGVYFDTQTTCESQPPCRPGLGGCLEKCGGFLATCLTANIKVPYAGPTAVSVLQWRPPSTTGPCASAISKFNAAVVAHEQHHVSDAKAILATKQRLPAKTFKACGKTNKEASAALHKEIADFVRSEVSDMEKKYENSVIAFHKTAAGQPINMDCGPC